MVYFAFLEEIEYQDKFISLTFDAISSDAMFSNQLNDELLSVQTQAPAKIQGLSAAENRDQSCSSYTACRAATITTWPRPAWPSKVFHSKR